MRWVLAGLGAAAIGAAVWALLPAGPDAPADGLAVPSGQAVTYLDTVQAAPGPEGLTVRFRFLAPAIARDGGTVSAEAAQEDMAWLCRTYALPRLPAAGPVPAQVIISLSDRPVEFGVPSPEATQYFEAFRVEGGTCHWEVY